MNRLSNINELPPGSISFITHLLQVDSNYYLPVAFASAGKFSGQIVAMLSGDFCGDILGNSERRRVIATSEFVENIDYATGRSQDSAHVIPLSKILSIFFTYPIRAKTNKPVIKWLRNYIWVHAMSGTLPAIFAGLSAIEVPKSGVYLSEVPLEMLDFANRLHITLLSRDGSIPNTALLNFQSPIENNSKSIPNINNNMPVLAPFDIELMNHLNNTDPSNLANLSQRNNPQNNILSMFSHNSFPLNLINLGDLNDPNSNMNLFRNSIRQPAFERASVELGLMPGLSMGSTGLNMGSLNHNEALDSMGYTNFTQPAIPQPAHTPTVTISPAAATSNTHTSNSNNYSFRVIHNKYVGPANEIFNLLDVPSSKWGIWIKRVSESDKVVVDMQSMQVMSELKFKKGYTQSWFLTANALVQIASEKPARLNPACSRANLKDGNPSEGIRLVNSYENLKNMIFTANEVEGNLIAADDVMSLCGFQSDVKFKRQKAVSIACTIPSAPFEYFVVEKAHLQNVTNNLVTSVTTHDLKVGQRLKPGQFFVFSFDAALRLILDPQSEPYLWKYELLEYANRFIYDLSNGNYISNLPQRPASTTQSTWPLAAPPISSHLNMQLPTWPNAIMAPNYFQPTLPTLDNSSNLLKRKHTDDDTNK